MKNIAIVGANGFIGKNFVEFFERKDFDITAVDLEFDCLSNNSKVKKLQLKTEETDKLVKSFLDVDVVIWLAHASVPATSDDSLEDDFKTNIAPIIKFLEAAKRNNLGLKKFIYLSSGGTVYGDVSQHIPIDEGVTLNPISNYGISKRVAESYISFLTNRSTFKSILLRPSNVYGKYQNLKKPQGIIGFAFKAIKDGQFLDLYDEGKITRDFIHVYDLAKAVYLCITQLSNLPGLTIDYNVGSQNGITIKEIIQKIEKISQKKLLINHKSSRSFDCEYSVLATSKIKNELSWDADIDIETGLSEVWDWIESTNL